jgi:hypothetical protein
MLEMASLAQRYDISVMLAVLPHTLFFALTAPEATVATGANGTTPVATSASGRRTRSSTAAAQQQDVEMADAQQQGGSAEDVLRPDGAAARRAILAEMAAVVKACLPGSSGEGGGAWAALHLQAVLSALDSLHRCTHPRLGLHCGCTCFVFIPPALG